MTSSAFARYERADYVLPTGERMNPRHPETAVYYDQRQVAYILQRIDVPRTKPSRCLTSFGELHWNVGDKISAFHDQTSARLGDYEIVGIATFDGRFMIGNVPDISLQHSVCK